ncbi:acyl-CoA synthetase/AMP-acid ligase II [Marssonina coronariae]|uniref:Acyl-CoA synthetase/AMP-acid ligase II n=1 Tax=Diplocarpon coronariae TaxID=2795749 RepID=A0A218Z4X2_9HELO|nr:acyl-CoA synthetase/AMP-acid ligase II [Marssonina coronariae]
MRRSAAGRLVGQSIAGWKRGLGRRRFLTSSYAAGPTEPPLLTHTIPQHFSSIVSLHGDRTALISRAQDAQLTYRDLDERSTALAHGLREKGVRKGERVAVSLGNGWECGVVSYAVFKLGAVLVPLNPAFNSPQVIAALSHLDTSHLIISTETNLPHKEPRENITLLRQICPALHSSKIESTSVPSLRNIILVDNSSSRIDVSSLTSTTSFHALLASHSSSKDKRIVPESPLRTDEVVNIQFTSGTTSSPKAACLTHHGVLNNGFFIATRMGLTPEDVVCCPPPMFHCFGSTLGYMATATTGAAILLPSEAFNPTATLLSIQEYRATALYGVATMFVAELELLASNAVPRTGFEHLRTGIAAGSSVPSSLMEKLHETLNLTGLTICYGMTETSPVSCMTTPDDPLEKRVDSVGRLLPHVRAKIVSVADGKTTVPIGERGELVVSGYNVMKGYWGDTTRTEEVRVVEEDENGRERVWMYTGDEAEMDADGYVKITGRIKDLIIRGGENIHPLEIENVVFRMEQVSEVSVAGVSDERYGEVVAAFVVVHKGVRVGVDDKGDGELDVDQEPRGRVLTRNMVREWVRRGLSGHLVPRYVFWVAEYPKTASGKIQKFRLKEMAGEWVREG